MLALLLALSISLAATDWPDLIIAPARVGLVPTLSEPPANLPKAIVNEATGEMLVPALRARYVAAQVSALYRLPGLSQEALDIAVDHVAAMCDIRVMDCRAAAPTWVDKLRSGVVWGVGGALVGAAVVGWIALRWPT